MTVFRNENFDDHEAVHFVSDDASGLRAIIAIHDRSLGPALGGLRMFQYANEEDAVSDVLRLSRGMSLKNAIAGIPYGGGKAVILGNPKSEKSPELFRALGRAIDRLNGAYITAEDVGTTVQDMDQIHRETPYARGTSNGVGDPSPHTARGVYLSIREAVKHRMGGESLRDIHIAVQGLGSVGANLAKMLTTDGARITVADIDEKKATSVAQALGANTVDANKILTVQADVLAPCAMGTVLTTEVAGALRTNIVCGAANNQLAGPSVAALLDERNVLYIPDFVANAGGVIGIGLEDSASAGEICARVDLIGDTVREILQKSTRNMLPVQVAEDVAYARMAASRQKQIIAA